MADDPYSVLGLPRTASDDEIRRAFRRLAKELHPDVRPNDPVSAERFKKVSSAYEIIGDADKRQRYDRGEIDAAGEPRRNYQQAGAGRPGGAGGPEFGFGDVFSDIFGPRGPRGGAGGFSLRGQDMRYTLDVEFLEAVLGARKRVTMPEGGQLDLTVPEGVIDGQVLRLKGKGSPGVRGGEPGDALVEIRVRPHAHFKRVDDDLLIEIPLTIDEAVLGGKIEVPTAAGRVTIAIPKGTSSGRSFRLKGKGVRNVSSGLQGDQIVTVRIVLPREIDESLAYFLAEWRKKHVYDPGRP
ncbi:MAG: DnaJ C-terminal domain-containing protein [Hyphomicrobiaceae bacterium]|nr:DnaJ C-terminal domain-containing protein [Hyphomicrobiaceae bacterium]